MRYRRLNHAGTVIAIASGYDVAVNDMSCLMNRSAELRMRTVDIERVRERGRMERRLLIAWSEQEQEAKKKHALEPGHDCTFFGGKALYLLRQRLGNNPPQFRLVMAGSAKSELLCLA